jgi:hypothetical protein
LPPYAPPPPPPKQYALQWREGCIPTALALMPTRQPASHPLSLSSIIFAANASAVDAGGSPDRPRHCLSRGTLQNCKSQRAQKCGGVSLRACRNPQRYAYKTTGVSFMRRSTCHLVVLGTGVSVYGNEFQQQPLFVLCRSAEFNICDITAVGAERCASAFSHTTHANAYSVE